MMNVFTSAGVEEAALKQSGPFYSWLRRVREGGGDQGLRRFALEVLRTCPASHGEHSPELVDQLEAFINDPALGSPALRPWMASDVWFWREIAKIAFEWGGAERTGDSLVRQVAVVIHFHLRGRDPASSLDAVYERLPWLL